jgi:hypothetical protein
MRAAANPTVHCAMSEMKTVKNRQPNPTARLTFSEPYQRPSSATCAGRNGGAHSPRPESPKTRSGKAGRTFAAAPWLGIVSCSMQMVCDGCPLWQAAPTLPRPVPHVLNAKLRRRLKLWLAHQAVRKVEDVGSPNSACDDAFINSCGGNNENVSADIASDEPRNCPTLAKSPAAKPAMKGLEHTRALDA